MSVKIRCRRTGANNDPCFQVIATDSRSAREGKYIELLGWYDPKRKERNFFLKLDRVADWTRKGAQVSDMVKSLMRKAKKGLMATQANPTPPPAPAAAAAEAPAPVEQAEPNAP